MHFLKPVIQACLLVTVVISHSASAQWNGPNNGYNNYGYNGYANQYNPAYYPPAYNSYYNGPGAYSPYNNGASNYQAPYYNAPYAGMPPYPIYRNNGGMRNMFHNRPFSGNSDFMEELWPGRGSIYDDVLPADGPWNRNWGRAPWNRNYDNLWGRNGGPSKWINMSDPKEGVAQAWEDMLVTPNALGTMPGGWKAPSISVPNPIDVGEEFKNVAKDMPSEMKDFSDGFNYGNGGYDNGGYNNGNKGGGITFDPSRHRK
jgi:hypothetical protein